MFSVSVILSWALSTRSLPNTLTEDCTMPGSSFPLSPACYPVDTHIILNMNNEHRKIQLSRTVEVLIGIFLALVSIFLILLCIAILTKGDFSNQMQMRKGITLFSLPATFAIFFSVLAINLLKPKTDQLDAELMSFIGWRFLAGIMFGFGLIILIFGNWIGVLLPVVVGAISLFKILKYVNYIKHCLAHNIFIHLLKYSLRLPPNR